MTEIIVTAIVGLVVTIVTSLTTWTLARKKYFTEVDHNKINNMQDSLQFYEQLVKSNNESLTEILARSEELASSNIHLLKEVQDLKIKVEMLTTVIRVELKDVDLSKYGITLDK